MINVQPQISLNYQEVQAALCEVLVHPLPVVRRELLDYLLRWKRMEARSFGLTIRYKGSIQVMELAAAELLPGLEQVLSKLDTVSQPLNTHPQLVAALREGRCTILEGAIALGISKSKAQAVRKGLQPSRPLIAPVAPIFRAILEGTRKKEIAVRFGVTDQTVSNARSKVLDLLLYQAVQQFPGKA